MQGGEAAQVELLLLRRRWWSFSFSSNGGGGSSSSVGEKRGSGAQRDGSEARLHRRRHRQEEALSGNGLVDGSAQHLHLGKRVVVEAGELLLERGQDGDVAVVRVEEEAPQSAQDGQVEGRLQRPRKGGVAHLQRKEAVVPEGQVQVFQSLCKEVERTLSKIKTNFFNTDSPRLLPI